MGWKISKENQCLWLERVERAETKESRDRLVCRCPDLGGRQVRTPEQPLNRHLLGKRRLLVITFRNIP